MKSKVQIIVEIEGIEEWGINWNDEITREEEILNLKRDISDSISRELWISKSNIKITGISIE